jgi:hypothetical protein
MAAIVISSINPSTKFYHMLVRFGTDAKNDDKRFVKPFHWPQASCTLLAGGGMKTGQVIGASDRTGSTAAPSSSKKSSPPSTATSASAHPKPAGSTTEEGRSLCSIWHQSDS